MRAIQDVVDALPYEPADQINADPGTTAFQQFLTGTGSLLEWWGDIGTVAKTSDTATIGDVLDFDILPGIGRRLQFPEGAVGEARQRAEHGAQHGLSRLGHLCDEERRRDAKRHKAAWSAAAHLGGKDLSMWTAAYPSGFQPYRKSHTNLDLWALAGYDKKYIGSYMDSQSTSYNHPNSAIEPRIPGIFQYYSIAEDELQKTFAGKQTAQQGADNVAAAWEKLTDKLGRENQVKYYRIAMGSEKSLSFPNIPSATCRAPSRAARDEIEDSLAFQVGRAFVMASRDRDRRPGAVTACSPSHIGSVSDLGRAETAHENLTERRVSLGRWLFRPQLSCSSSSRRCRRWTPPASYRSALRIGDRFSMSTYCGASRLRAVRLPHAGNSASRRRSFCPRSSSRSRW